MDKIKLGSFCNPKDLASPDDDDNWIEIDDGKHTGAAVAVWRMVDDKQSRSREQFCRLLGGASDMMEALKLMVDMYDLLGGPKNFSYRKVTKLISELDY